MKEALLALRTITPEEFGQRVRYVRLLSGLSGTALSTRIEAAVSTVSWIERARARTVDLRNAVSIANATAGEGMLAGVDPREVLEFLQGLRDELSTRYVVAGGDRPTTSRTSANQAKAVPEDVDASYERFARRRSLGEDADAPYPGKNSRAAA